MLLISRYTNPEIFKIALREFINKNCFASKIQCYIFRMLLTWPKPAYCLKRYKNRFTRILFFSKPCKKKWVQQAVRELLLLYYKILLRLLSAPRMFPPVLISFSCLSSLCVSVENQNELTVDEPPLTYLYMLAHTSSPPTHHLQHASLLLVKYILIMEYSGPVLSVLIILYTFILSSNNS